ncbi:MAG: RNA polymerase subunit sigma [Caulobacterales bacterium 68-7]|nr:MAG: RNA polymerase subunit sigma [Caulobacterales bacterium 68-7]
MDADTSRAHLSAALSLVAAGDRNALEEVYRLTSPKLFGVILRILHDRAEAEDVLQEVYLTIWRKAGSFDATRASPITWLATMARNRAIDRARSRGLRATAPEEAAAEVADDAAPADARLVVSQQTQQLETCLDQLPGDHAAAVRTAFFGGVTYEALAERLGLPLGTLKGWIRRSLMKLRLCLGDAYG